MNKFKLHPVNSIRKGKEVSVHPYFREKEMIKQSYFSPGEINYHRLPYLTLPYLEIILSKPTWHHMKDFLLALLVLPGGKTVTAIAKACFFIDQDLSSFNRFLSEYGWSLGEVKAKLANILLRSLKVRSLKGRLLIHGGLLVSTDRSLSAKQILEIYAARFCLEIAIRDLKKEFGLGHYQFRKPLARRRFVHLVLFARTFWQLVLLKTKPEWLIRRYGSIPIEEAPLSWKMAKRKLRVYMLS